MIRLGLIKPKIRPYRFLFLGAHSDDIEIGCGGTILRLLNESSDAEVRWVVFGAKGERAVEANKSATLFLNKTKKRKVTIMDFRDGFFPYIGARIKEYFEVLKKEISPDLIFTHYRNDLHQDHRLISELTWNTFRDHLILEYEILKYDGDFGSPNFYLPLNKETAQKKIENIRKCFRSQDNRKWFTEDTFFSILRIRGTECNAPEKYAEGFYCRKLIF